MNLADLATFAHVADTGSFTKAAKRLGVPKSTVSRRVSRLEDELGVPLLARTGRAIHLTDVGRRLADRSRPALRELEDVERELRDASDEPAGTLRLTAPHDIGGTAWFARLLTTYRARHPKVALDVELTNRLVDLVGEAFDVALRPGRAGGSTALVTRRLASIAAGLFASPAYLARRGAPRTPQDLISHDCVAHRALVERDGWRLRRADGTEVSATIDDVVCVNDFNLVLHAVVDGGGIGLVPRFASDRLEARGDIVRVLPDWSFGEGSLSLVWPQSRHLAPRVRAFVDHAVAFVGDGGLSEPA